MKKLSKVFAVLTAFFLAIAVIGCNNPNGGSKGDGRDKDDQGGNPGAPTTDINITDDDITNFIRFMQENASYDVEDYSGRLDPTLINILSNYQLDEKKVSLIGICINVLLTEEMTPEERDYIKQTTEIDIIETFKPLVPETIYNTIKNRYTDIKTAIENIDLEDPSDDEEQDENPQTPVTDNSITDADVTKWISFTQEYEQLEIASDSEDILALCSKHSLSFTKYEIITKCIAAIVAEEETTLEQREQVKQLTGIDPVEVLKKGISENDYQVVKNRYSELKPILDK